MRAAFYARVSSALQRDAQSIESQLTTLAAYVARQGWELVGRYVDDGRTAKSGHLEKRDGLVRALADAAAHRFDVLVVVDLDRLTRSEDLTERGAVLGAFQRAAVQIAIASTGQLLDLSSSMGDLFAGLQAYFSAEWIRKHREKVLRGRELAASRGRKPAGRTPYGYRRDSETGRAEPGEHAAVVREIYERVAGGDTARALGDELERRGIASPEGGRWGASVARMIRRTYYRGEWTTDRRRGQRIAATPLVTEELWYAANDALARNALRGLRRTRAVYLCEAILRCGVCGAKVQIHGEAVSRRGARGAYYRCSGRRHPQVDTPRCTLPMVQTAGVDARVWAAICELVQRADLVDRLAGRVAGAEEAQAWQSDVSEARAQLDTLRRAELALMDRFARGLISDAAMDEQLAKMTARRGWLERQAATAGQAAAGAQRAAATAEQAVAVVRELRAALADAEPADRQRIVRALVPGWGEHAVVLGADGGLTIGALIRVVPDASWSRDAHKGQDAAPGHGVQSLQFRLLA